MNSYWPNLITLSRIAFIPPVMWFLYLGGPPYRWVALVLFVLAALTDALDGWMARRYGLQTSLGRFLDPVADKLLVGSVLLMLASVREIRDHALIPAAIILCREIFVAGLREFLAEIRIPVPVSRLARWKTTLQMVALGFLVVGKDGAPFLPFVPVRLIGEALLWLAAILTIWTGLDYFLAGLSRLGEEGRE